MAFNITDSFIGSSGTAITSHTTDQGHPWVRPTGGASGPFNLDGAGHVVDGWGTGAFAVVDTAISGSADYSVFGTVDAAYGTLITRCNPTTGARVQAFWHPSVSGWRMSSTVTGYFGSGAGGPTPVGTARAVELRVVGDTYSLYVDGALALSGTDTNHSAAGSGGIASGGVTAFSMVGSGTASGGLSPAVLSSPGSSGVTATTANGTVTSDTAGGTLHCVATSSNSQPSNAQIKAGSGGTIVVHGSVTAVSGANSVSLTGLTASTTYYLWFLQDNGADSNVPSSVSFTTSASGTPPVITSNGGGPTASISVAEGATAITTVTATAGSSGTTVFSVSGGVDAGDVSINSSTGALVFSPAPNFEGPADDGANNTYIVIVRATAPDASYDEQTITVTVTNVAEAGPPRILFFG